MKEVAKLLIIDNQDKYLLMYRSDHPSLPNDPDLPGGTVEAGESSREAMLREVVEEAGIALQENQAEEMYNGVDYSTHRTRYSLYISRLDNRPDVTLSWEHSAYEWVDRELFLKKAKSAIDTYMHMVHDTLNDYRLS